MAVGTVQIFDNVIQDWMDGSVSLWGAGSPGYYASLYAHASGTDPDDAWATRTQITHTEITAQGDYDQVDVATRTIGRTGGTSAAEYLSAIISFGATVDIQAKYLIIAEGDEASPATDDPLIFWVDLDSTSGTSEAQSIGAAFTIDDSANGWFYVAEQA